MLRMKAQDGDWRGAIGVVEQGVSRRLIDKAEGKRLRSVLLTAAALENQERDPDESLALAQDALRLAPSLVPAAVIVARRLAAKGDTGKAARALETAWKAEPHPDLAEAHLAARPGDSALDRLKRARTLEKLAPNARESRFIVARAAIDAREFAVAREALEALVLQKPRPAPAFSWPNSRMQKAATRASFALGSRVLPVLLAIPPGSRKIPFPTTGSRFPPLASSASIAGRSPRKLRMRPSVHALMPTGSRPPRRWKSPRSSQPHRQHQPRLPWWTFPPPRP